MKDFGVKPYLFPMPTYMIATYNEDDTVDAMAMPGAVSARRTWWHLIWKRTTRPWTI